MEQFNRILESVNAAIILAFSAAFIYQFIYILLFFAPVKKYPTAKKLHKIAVIIPAHNEESVILSTVKNILKQSYPKEFYEIFVIADNCNDRTAEFAALAGARVLTHVSEDKEKRNAGCAVDYAVRLILKERDDFELFVRFDADNIPHPHYLKFMNDAFDAGVKAAKGYNHSLNFTQNTCSGISALWYLRDNAFTCRARSFLRLSQMLVGGGMMFAAELVKDGFGCSSNSEDAQFSLKLARQKIRASFVREAVVYEDQPSNLNDLFKRNMRMGGGLFRLFFTDGIKSLFCFFRTLNFSLIDLFLSLVFIPAALVGVLWFPFYYVYSVVYALTVADYALVARIGVSIGYILGFAFILPFILQALIACIVERKQLKIPLKKLVVPLILFPFYMIVYALGITLGALGFSRWRTAERNAYYDEQFIAEFERACGNKPHLRK